MFRRPRASLLGVRPKLDSESRATRKRKTRLGLETFEDRLVPAVSATFQLDNDWGSGFVGSIRIANDEDTSIPNWRLEFDFSHQITQIWNGVVSSHAGNHYEIGNAGYNSTIAPRSVTEFGFVGSPGNVTTFPTNYVLNGVPLGGGSLPVISITDASITEGDATNSDLGFAVVLSSAATYSVAVRYSTRDGSALAASDYRSTSGTLTFQPGETRKDILATVLGDLRDEFDESFQIVLSNPTGATLGTATALGTILDNDPPPVLQVSDVTVQEPTTLDVDPGFFHTSGNQILDAADKPVRIAGVNWFGMETNAFAPGGLWVRNYRDMMDQMRQLGFNTIRLPFSNQLFNANSNPSGIDYAKNPDLQGLKGIGIIDRLVAYAGQIGLRIILDHHRSDAGNGAQGSGLWYTGAYPESRWISDWAMLAARYAGNPTVIGADLHNEPHGSANWGAGGANDWRLAAERAGNAVLAANPNWLIITEGVEVASSGWTWWGGNLSNAGTHPVRLNVPGRLVYSPHDYPASVYPQPWFSDPNYPNNLYSVWDRHWGYLFRQGTAPILLGEFGTKLQTASDRQWLNTLINYLGGDLNGDGQSDLTPGQHGASWMWWTWNPDSSDTGGILQDDWIHVQQEKVDLLEPVQFPWAGGTGTQKATFTVSLGAPSEKTVRVRYATANGTAEAGLDFDGVSGALEFAPGQTTKLVQVNILADAVAENPENFFLRLSDPENATLSDTEGEGTIRDADDPPPPTISVGDVRVTEGDSGTRLAEFTVTLSAASAQSVTVQYATVNGSALAVQDYLSRSGTLTFAPGVRSRTIQVPIVGDLLPESTETFRLQLSSPTNASLGVDRGTGTIVDNDSSSVRVTFTVRRDWGTGFVADMAIINDGPDDINDWILEFDLDRNITNLWNATIVSHVGTRYVIRAASWNRVIKANGGRVEFGFEASPGNVSIGPRNLVLNGLPLP